MLALFANEFALFICAAFIYFAFSARAWSKPQGVATRPQRFPSGAQPSQGKAKTGHAASSDSSVRQEAKKDSSDLEQRTKQACKTIRDCNKNKDLAGASRAFEWARLAGNNRLLYNCFLDACVECGDLEQAASIVSQAEAADIADTVTYNTMMKG